MADISDSPIALLEKARVLEFSNSRSLLPIPKATFRARSRSESAIPRGLFGKPLWEQPVHAYITEACSDRVIRYYKSKPAGAPAGHEQEARLVVRTDSALRLETASPSRVRLASHAHAVLAPRRGFNRASRRTRCAEACAVFARTRATPRISRLSESLDAAERRAPF